jgi:hypothetical protein
MPAALSAVKLRRDAENPKADLGLRAEVVVELLSRHPAETDLQLSPAVIAVVADRSGPETALRVALKVAPVQRTHALTVALAKPGPDPQPSMLRTRALAELGRVDDALAALSRELAWLSAQASDDTPVQSAFGAHVLDVTGALGAAHTRVWALSLVLRDKAQFDRLRQCVRAARVTTAQEPWRKTLHALLDEAWLGYWAAQSPES